MAECKPFDRLDPGRAQPALEQLRDAILAEYPGKVEACSSGRGQITLKTDLRSSQPARILDVHRQKQLTPNTEHRNLSCVRPLTGTRSERT